MGAFLADVCLVKTADLADACLAKTAERGSVVSSEGPCSSNSN